MSKITYLLKIAPAAGFKMFLGLPFAVQAITIIAGLLLTGLAIG